MSRTITVPASVPSLFHNSIPEVPSSAAKISMLPSTISSTGREDPDPGQMSFTRNVPCAEPSVLHSSMPLASAAGKYITPFMTVVLRIDWELNEGLELDGPGKMSLISAARGPSARAATVRGPRHASAKHTTVRDARRLLIGFPASPAPAS